MRGGDPEHESVGESDPVHCAKFGCRSGRWRINVDDDDRRAIEKGVDRGGALRASLEWMDERLGVRARREHHLPFGRVIHERRACGLMMCVIRLQRRDDDARVDNREGQGSSSHSRRRHSRNPSTPPGQVPRSFSAYSSMMLR